MSQLSRQEIVDGLTGLLGPERVLTDQATLEHNSHDRFRKFETLFGIYTNPLPAAVVKVATTEQVARVLRFLDENQINCVPRTGATATEGGLETTVENSVVLDGSAMNRIVKIDEKNMLATVQCGVGLQELDDQLRERGLTTGHSPQSKPLAQMGGLVATRSIGQFSTLYGGIEDMVVGLEAVFPGGVTTRIKNVPRRACGPDIRHVVIGNEGALCFITEVTVKLFKLRPENDRYLGFTIGDMQTGFDILRQVMVDGYQPSVARLYDQEDGAQHGFDRFAGDQCVLIFKTEGPKAIAEATATAISDLCRTYDGCKEVDAKIIEDWFLALNWGPEKIAAERAFIKEHLEMGFTTEVSGNWSTLHNIYQNAIRRIREEFPRAKDLTMLGCHSSHAYQTGANLYFVYDYKVKDCKPEEEIDRYHIPLNAMIVEETLKAGGSMVHHHGVGKYRVPWIKEEHGSSYHLLESLKRTFDPNNIMNFGTIFPQS